MKLEDLPQVLSIERQSFEDPWPESAFRSDLDDKGLAFTRAARILGVVVGYLVAWRVATELHLTNLAVREAYRRAGIGQGLLDELLAEAARLGVDSITLEVRVSNEAAIRLYQRNGFESVAVRKRYYQVGNEDALLMLRKESGGK
jgi:ribosomal-protein-alanine N-acetyltransferase